MRFLPLLAIPPLIFMTVGVISISADALSGIKTWWAVPLFFAIGIPTVAAGMVGIIGCILKAFDR